MGRAFRSERGMALPLALIILVILTALTTVFSTLARTEPMVGRNHSMAAQARGFAESGTERALWALSNPTHADGIPNPLGGAIAAPPYEGNTFFQVSTQGGFTVTVAAGATSTQRSVTAVGWAPDSDGILRAAKKIQITATQLRWNTIMPECALCVKGSVDVSGNANIDARGNHCAGHTPQGGVMATGLVNRAGSSEVYGPGNNTPNELTGTDMPMGPTQTIPTMTWEDLEILRTVAKRNKTYYSRADGTIEFNASNPLPPQGGVLFIDTTTGNDLQTSPTMTPSNQWGSVSITGNQTWSGWIIALGDVTITGTVNLTGAVYARNDFVFNGNGSIRGSVTAENKLNTVQSSVDSSQLGSSSILYDCEAARTAGGTVSDAWILAPGSYVEIAGQ